jgi:hypothetical protein
VAAFGNATLSVSGDSTSAFFAPLGSGYFGSGSIVHDDGVSMYVDSYSNVAVSSRRETSLDVSNFSVAPGFHD